MTDIKHTTSGFNEEEALPAKKVEGSRDDGEHAVMITIEDLERSLRTSC